MHNVHKADKLVFINKNLCVFISLYEQGVFLQWFQSCNVLLAPLVFVNRYLWIFLFKGREKAAITLGLLAV